LQINQTIDWERKSAYSHFFLERTPAHQRNTVMAGLGHGSPLTAILLGRATRRYEQGGETRAILHGRGHRWTAQALMLSGLTLGLLLLHCVLAPPLFVFGLLWILNGADQALIAIPSSTLLAEYTVA